MIDNKRLKELVRLMVDNDLYELDLRDKAQGVTIKRAPAGGAIAMPVHHGAPAYAAMPAPTAAGGGAGGAKADDGLIAIESPMVGTFYTRPNPEAPAYTEVGKSVGPESVVCLIEAMKVFNEIKAEVSGVVERVLVENGKPVEYGQKLFLLRPNG